jgi:hypothetical protein
MSMQNTGRVFRIVGNRVHLKEDEPVESVAMWYTRQRREAIMSRRFPSPSKWFE